jgi:hypothetical protein
MSEDLQSGGEVGGGRMSRQRAESLLKRVRDESAEMFFSGPGPAGGHLFSDDRKRLARLLKAEDALRAYLKALDTGPE